MDERFEKILSDPKTIPAVVGLLSFGAGVGIGYVLGRRTKRDVYIKTSDIPDFEFDASGLAAEIKEPGFVVDERTKELKDLQFRELVIDPTANPEPGEAGSIIEVRPVEDEESEVEEPEVEIVTNNAFAESEDGWDYEEEIKGRNHHDPYILHKDEFFEDDDEFDYRQVSLTYYAGDNIMADDDNSPVYNYETVVGPLRFGHGSGEPNIVYVRNPKLRMEYEIILHEGYFQVEVMGAEIEETVQPRDLKHSAPRFRQE